MLICKKCGKSFSTKIRIDGIKRNLQTRKYCLECSAFGSGNTRDLTKPLFAVCACGREIKGRRKPKCRFCYWNEKHTRSLKKVYDIIGTACWKCGFDGGMETVGVLDFHHMRDKLFLITGQNMTNRSWSSVFEEMQKCASLCCRCHRLVHYGIISQKDIDEIYGRRWQQIRVNLGIMQA